MQYTIDLLQRSIRESDAAMDNLLRVQMVKATDWRYGGCMNDDFGLVAYNSGSHVTLPVILYFCPGSRYFRSDAAYESASRLFTFLNANTRPSGVVDLHLANYYSAPDTAFCVIGLCDAYQFICERDADEHGKDLKKRLYDAICRLADGVFNGGFHTPNHRWVESAALSMAMNITGKTAYRTRIDKFLAEGIDCNADGEYTERSSGGYNFINNMALLHLYEELKMPELLEPIRRNLKMMAAYYHTNTEIFTQNSIRQDRGTKVYAAKYIPQYLKVGHLLGDGELLAMARAIIDDAILNGRGFPVSLTDLLRTPELFEIPDVEPKLPDEYDYHFRESGIVRMMHNGCTVAILENQDTFFYLQYGGIDLYIRGGIHFFNCRHLRVNNLRPIDGGYAMDYHGEGTYYLPFDKAPTYGVFRESEKALRGNTGPICVDAVLEVRRTEKGFAIRVRADGCTKVPIRFEIGLNSDAVIFGDGYTVRANPGGKLVASKGSLRVDVGRSSLKIGPAFADNFITEGLFGSVPVSESKYNLFFNAITPFEREFTLEPVDQIEE